MNTKVKKQKSQFIKNGFIARIFAVVLIILIIVVAILGIRKWIDIDSKTTKVGFEDIGELATQSAYCTEVNVTDASRELWGVTIPFTQSKYIYSYNIVIKAGFDFEEIEWDIKDTTIKVKLPETRILSSEIDRDSFKVYHEDESIFRQISLEENNEALNEMVSRAEEDAIANGLFDNACDNAKTIIKVFFSQVYDMNEYEIVFIDKK